MPTNTRESDLETLIVDWLVTRNGYEQSMGADHTRECAEDEISDDTGPEDDVSEGEY
jgi:type I restriction enzyme R subunit